VYLYMCEYTHTDAALTAPSLPSPPLLAGLCNTVGWAVALALGAAVTATSVHVLKKYMATGMARSR